jgi:hypothetical protein
MASRLQIFPPLNHPRQPAHRSGLSGGREQPPQSTAHVWRLRKLGMIRGRDTGGRPATELRTYPMRRVPQRGSVRPRYHLRNIATACGGQGRGEIVAPGGCQGDYFSGGRPKCFSMRAIRFSSIFLSRASISMVSIRWPIISVWACFW